MKRQITLCDICAEDTELSSPVYSFSVSSQEVSQIRRDVELCAKHLSEVVTECICNDVFHRPQVVKAFISSVERITKGGN